MKRFWKRCCLGLLLSPLLLAGGCIIVDDDGHFYDDTETIQYVNHTDFYVDNYIDGDYVGTVPRNGRLEVEGDYEGLHTFESVSQNEILTWGPKDLRVYDGDVVVLDLVEGGGYQARIESKVRR